MRRAGNDSAAESIRHRLRNLARERGEESRFVLMRYASQRLLYRLGESPYGARFLLKGATLFAVWSDRPHRPTLDIDLLGTGTNDAEELAALFRDLCAQEGPSDGLTFLTSSVKVEGIREGREYEGVRVSVQAMLGKSRLELRIDIGFGDDVFPEPCQVEVAGLLGVPPARLLAYPPEAVVAEKLQAMVELGIANSRMKDLYDIWVLSKERHFDGGTLSESVRRTFQRRKTSVPSSSPLALTAEFSTDPLKTKQWMGFLSRTGLSPGADLGQVILELADFLLPVLSALAAGNVLRETWTPGGPWHPGADGGDS